MSVLNWMIEWKNVNVNSHMTAMYFLLSLLFDKYQIIIHDPISYKLIKFNTY